jgi:hypothetical protein
MELREIARSREGKEFHRSGISPHGDGVQGIPIDSLSPGYPVA